MSTLNERLRRRFSEEIKLEAVKRIDSGQVSIAALSRELEVSKAGIYKWRSKYSLTYRRQHRIVVEKKSNESRVYKLEKQLEALQAALGRKQLKIDYLEKLIDITEESENVEIRKKGEPGHLNGSGKTENCTPGQ